MRVNLGKAEHGVPHGARLDEVVREEGHARASEADVHAPPGQGLQPLQHRRCLRADLTAAALGWPCQRIGRTSATLG